MQCVSERTKRSVSGKRYNQEKNLTSNVQLVTQSCLTLCDPRDCSAPGLPVHHELPGLAQTHVDQIGDAIQPSLLLLSPSLPAFSLSQHQSLFQ